jgi:hypothetical protein
MINLDAPLLRLLFANAGIPQWHEVQKGVCCCFISGFCFSHEDPSSIMGAQFKPSLVSCSILVHMLHKYYKRQRRLQYSYVQASKNCVSYKWRDINS